MAEKPEDPGSSACEVGHMEGLRVEMGSNCPTPRALGFARDPACQDRFTALVHSASRPSSKRSGQEVFFRRRSSYSGQQFAHERGLPRFRRLLGQMELSAKRLPHDRKWQSAVVSCRSRRESCPLSSELLLSQLRLSPEEERAREVDKFGALTLADDVT